MNIRLETSLLTMDKRSMLSYMGLVAVEKTKEPHLLLSGT